MSYEARDRGGRRRFMGRGNRTEMDVMKCGARVALGVAGGYFLGRTKKMKLALMLAGMAAGRAGRYGLLILHLYASMVI